MITFLKFICVALEKCCCLTHPFVNMEIFLTGRHCNLAILSYYIDEKFNLNSWKLVDRNYYYCSECDAVYHNKWFLNRNCTICGKGVIK